LKSYAATTEGAVTAGFGFDPETYAPTYKLVYGAPGRSLALEIAERLGMPATVVADARSRRSGRESQLAAHLARVDAELAAIQRERQIVEEERAAVARERQGILERESRLVEREAVVKRRLDDRLNETLREARREVDRVVGRLKERVDVLANPADLTSSGSARPRLSTGDVGALRSDARQALDAIAGRIEHRDTSAGDAPLTQPPAVGETVFVRTFGAKAIVRDVSARFVEVEVRGKRLRVPLADLGAAPQAEAADSGKPSDRGGSRGGVVVSASAETRETRELVLIGSTVDAAIDRAGKFLDDALLADERRLRIVHGHGTGRLREALTKFFREHPLVASVSRAPENEGGAGATIVELKE
jgi:DNA mismatch repair protein MutS2